MAKSRVEDAKAIQTQRSGARLTPYLRSGTTIAATLAEPQIAPLRGHYAFGAFGAEAWRYRLSGPLHGAWASSGHLAKWAWHRPDL